MDDESRHGCFHWNELLTTDVAKAKNFFSQVIGWSFDTMPMPEGGTYYVATVDDEPVAGLMNMPASIPAGTPPHWFSYLEVDDLEERLSKVRAAGGNVLREPFEVPEVGRIAVIADPTGAVLGLIKPADDYDD
jgi:uncharacterized protein